MDDDTKKKLSHEMSSILGMESAEELVSGMFYIWDKEIMVTNIMKTMSEDNYKTHNFYKSVISTEISDKCSECGIYCRNKTCLYDLSCDEYKIKDILE